MSVYLIADIDVYDPETYAEYGRRARPVVEAYGGVYRILGGEPRALSQAWTPRRIVMIEFESEAALRRCFESEEYRRIAGLRERSTTSRAVIATGYSLEETSS